MRWFVMASFAVTALLPVVTWGQVADSAYYVMYEERCRVYHGTTGAVTNAAAPRPLRAFSPERVLESLTAGAMAVNASGLSEQEKRGLAAFSVE